MAQPWWDYPPNFFETGEGRMHYVDVGPRESRFAPLIFVHGTPVCSYVYRRLIEHFRHDRRVVAIDHLGFGLSDKRPAADYRPSALAAHFERLVQHLALDRPILAVHDFGGPIALPWAIRHPEQLSALILFNTWMWPLTDTPAATLSRIFASPAGRLLYLRWNFSVRVMLPLLFADRSKLTRSLHRLYQSCFPGPEQRHALWTFAKELLGSSAWYQQLWDQRGALQALPALFLWGMRDKAFGPEALKRWKEALPQGRTVPFADSGHFVQEEEPEAAIQAIHDFLQDTSRRQFDC